MVVTFSRLGINRAWLPILHVSHLKRENRLRTGNRESQHTYFTSSSLSALSLLILVIDYLKNMLFYHTTHSLNFFHVLLTGVQLSNSCLPVIFHIFKEKQGLFSFVNHNDQLS